MDGRRKDKELEIYQIAGMDHKCLNCGTELIGAYCYHCGQKSSTHRITFTKFITHDLMHGLFHLDKGILYTLRALLLSPGYAVKSFINGKRVQHYNIFALFIITIALKTFIDTQVQSDFGFHSEKPNEGDARANELLDHYYKVFYLLCIPVYSFITFLFFRKLKYNYTEHIVLNCFLFTGGFIYSLLLSLIGWLINDSSLPVYGFCILAIYLLVGYYQATRQVYNPLGFTWRVAVIFILFLVLLSLGLITFITIFYEHEFIGQIGWVHE
jgi:hypothetical protein